MSTLDNTGSPKPAGDSSVAGSAPYNGRPDDLHDLFVQTPTHPDDEDPLATLRNDPNYAALLRDLEAIADAAKQLLQPVDEAPSDNVWAGIASKLKVEPSEA